MTEILLFISFNFVDEILNFIKQDHKHFSFDHCVDDQHNCVSVPTH